MWQFIYGSNEMFDDLAQRARRACIRFEDQEMPPGASPSRATIGFEVEAQSGRVRLLVERGVTYDGTNAEIGRWIVEGSRSFDDVAELQSWLGSTLRDGYQAPTLTTVSTPTSGTTLYDAQCELDDIGAKGLRIAMRPDCPMKDLPS